MYAKAAVKELLDRLPDDCTLDDVQYHLYVLQVVERGLSEVALGQTTPHEEVEQELKRKWVLGAGA